MRAQSFLFALALGGAAVVGLSASMIHNVHAASAGVVDIDDELRATIQKEKTKQRRAEHTAGGGQGGSGGCGQIDIGNEEEKKGSRQVAAREKTVIVTGPVINATKCR